MRRSYLLYLEDILASANKIKKYVGDYFFENFTKDEMKVDAIIMTLHSLLFKFQMN